VTEYILQTERLRLRPFTDNDLEDLFAILGDAETMHFYPRPYTRDETLEWIRLHSALHRARGLGLQAIELRETGEFVGNCGPSPQTVDGVEEIELGWHIARNRWHRGYASEAAAACRDHAFDTIGLRRLISLIRPENVPSRKVAERIGMMVEKETDRDHYRHLVYAIERHDVTGPGR
jgi:RimJ/RimL family protein N-acetyltransferase